MLRGYVRVGRAVLTLAVRDGVEADSHGIEELALFRLELAGVCFVSILSACALVEDRLMVFDMMGVHGVEKRQVHTALASLNPCLLIQEKTCGVHC
jgi:hypothetical protein